MTTLIYITVIFLCLMIIIFMLGMIYTIRTINKDLGDNEDVAIGMVSVLGLIWSIVSLITFYKLII